MSEMCYRLAGILSLLSLVLILVNFKIDLDNPKWTLAYPKTYETAKEYALYLSAPKTIESVLTLVGWLASTFLTSSWMKFRAGVFFLALNMSGVDMLLIIIYGTCYWASYGQCAATDSCMIKANIKPSILIPIYFFIQVMSICVLCFCTKACNSAVIQSSEHQKTEYTLRFWFLFGKISTGFQLAGLFLVSSIILILIYLVCVWHVLSIFKSAPSTTYIMAFLCLLLLSKLLNFVTTFYGARKKVAAFFVSSLTASVLCIILVTVSLVIYWYAYTNLKSRIQRATDKCQFSYVCLLIYSMEILSFRAVTLGYQRLRKAMFPLEIDERLTRIPASKVKCEKVIGKGRFGEVWFGKITLKCDSKDARATNAAIKRLKTSATAEMKCWFFEEVILLSRFNHENIIKLIGLCMDTKPAMLCMEFLDGGSLLDYLHMQEPRKCLSLFDLAEIIFQVAKACCYLEDEGYIHRDIAARNCLISCEIVDGISKPKVVKLADFGLAKDVKSAYKNIYKSDEPIVPIQHTAPEGLNGSFHCKSDVWCFAVLVWEVFSWCAKPFGRCYSTMGQHSCPLNEYTLDEIENYVCKDKKTLLDFRDPCTSSFTESIKFFLECCWKFEPNERPNFQEVRAVIQKFGKSCSHSPCFPFETLQEQRNNAVSAETCALLAKFSVIQDGISNISSGSRSTYKKIQVIEDVCFECEENC